MVLYRCLRARTRTRPSSATCDRSRISVWVLTAISKGSSAWFRSVRPVATPANDDDADTTDDDDDDDDDDGDGDGDSVTAAVSGGRGRASVGGGSCEG